MFTRSLPEPWRVKSVEPIRLIDRDARARAIEEAGHNVFRLRAEDVFVDLLTDSGTSAMSAAQWAGLQTGDESYAGARSWPHLEQVVEHITGMPSVLPVHQGRGAETVYCRTLVEPGDIVLGNLHFDTTRAHIRNRGGRPVDVLAARGYDLEDPHPFKGDADLDAAERVVAAHPGRVKLFILTVTANTNGGQPVSLAGAAAVADLCRRHGITLLVDAARFAENAYLISEREPSQLGRPPAAIARDLFQLADVVAMSAKKDGLVNIGGFLAARDPALYDRFRPWAILYEGYVTYGGLAGRDLEAIARGLIEGLEPGYLAARIEQVRTLHRLLVDAQIPVMKPPGGHSVVVEAGRFLSHLGPARFPAESLAAALYVEGGIRAVGLGGLAFSDPDPVAGAPVHAPPEYLRLAVPRRVYTDNHLAYVAEVLEQLWSKRESIEGLELTEPVGELAHFTARFRQAGGPGPEL
jgi:tryptophanase